jgi:hypothetical protein
MCQQEFEEKALDFLGRCESCFKKYLDMEEKPDLGIPFTPVSKAVK